MSSEKYIHSKVENRIYSYWEKKKLFKPKKNKKKYSIVIPPPNVTGSIHVRLIDWLIRAIITKIPLSSSDTTGAGGCISA